MEAYRTGVRAAVAAVATALLLYPTAVAHAAASSIELSATPGQQSILAGLPCLPAPPVTIGMTSIGDRPVYADTFLRADGPLELSRAMFSSYVPAGATVTAPLTVEAPYGTEPGGYAVTLDSPQAQDLRVPITVTAPPVKGPGDSLLLGEQADPSSTYVTAETAFDPCGAVDGDFAWSTSAWASDTPGEFPDTYTVTLPEPAPMNRLDMHTHETQGLSDWDVRVQTSDGAWQTMAQVRGNTGPFVSSTFADVVAAKVEIVALDAVDHGLSRIREIEAYQGGPPPPV